jgi:TRAP-type mannitol/chloroaromatic compound transport system permease large subunit
MALFGAQALIGVYTLAGGDDFVKKAIMALPMENGSYHRHANYSDILRYVSGLDGILFLTMPLFLPIILEMGFDPIWFGVVFCMDCHIGYLSLRLVHRYLF